MRGVRGRVMGPPLRRVGLAGSFGLHLLALLTLLVGGGMRSARPLPRAYRVELVAAPALPSASRAAPAETTGPSPDRPGEVAPPRPAAPPSPRAPSARPAPTEAAPAREQPAEPPASVEAPPGRSGDAGVGSDPATVRTEGVEFPFPGYLRNLVAQVYRRWHPAPSNARLEAEIFFFVHRDGSVTGLQFITRSGVFAFDLEAQGAVEAAARTGAFGALPDGYGADVLPVSFFFNPQAAR
ncbi:MAG: TonB C-terminal domain-containing protein [Gemmatimonadetes bacterium]|nr:TonB C-terminal domain-containing protein [Gemmatimonadota bacterium]